MSVRIFPTLAITWPPRAGRAKENYLEAAQVNGIVGWPKVLLLISSYNNGVARTPWMILRYRKQRTTA